MANKKNTGWKEAADQSGKAPRHRAVARKSKLIKTLRVPMSEPEMKDEIWTIKDNIARLDKEFDIIWTKFQSQPPQISNTKYDNESARIERERDSWMQRMKDLIAASKINSAREFGRQAAREGKMLAPAQDKHVLELMAGNEVGNPENIPIMKAWREGWAQEIAERHDTRKSAIEKWVEATLVNDENATDGEMLDHFIANGVSKTDAVFYISQRNAALRDPLGFQLKHR